MNDLIVISNMDSTPYEELLHSENNSDEEIDIDDDELEALDDDSPFFDLDNEEELPEHKRIKLDDEPLDFFEPVWHEIIKNLKSTVSGTQLIVAKDIDAKLTKIFAIFNSHQHVLDYIYRIPIEERMLYEWILPHMPAKLVFDIDSSYEHVINNTQYQSAMFDAVYYKTIEVFQEMNLDYRHLKFLVSDSSRKEKFSIHLVSNFYFESWEIQCQFVKKVYSELIKEKDIDGSIYTAGGRAMRTILSTKFGKNSYLRPIENDQDRYDRNKESIDSKNNMQFFQYHPFLMPKIREETLHLHHMVTYIDEEYNYKIEVDKKFLKNAGKVRTQKEAGNSVVLEGLANLITENAEKFKDYVDSYHLWITTGIKMVVAGLPYECFRIVSMQCSKFREEDCQKKWENLQSSYGAETKDINQLKKFMRYIGIDVSIDYSYETGENLDFQFDMFNKDIMIDYSLKTPAVRPEYYKYTMTTLNRYFGIVTLTKMEVFQVRYDNNDKVVEIVQRYSKNSFMDAFEPLRIFLCFWLKNSFRRQYRRYVFEPEVKVQNDEFNLFLGMQIKLYPPQNMVYDEQRVVFFQQHVMKYFCRNNMECYEYFMNYFARKVQMPGNKNGVGIVLKSAKQGVGKGLVIDLLLGKNIFGNNCYSQVSNIDGLIGKFNSILQNKILVNVDEVSMTKAQANEVKGLITGETMIFEKKGLDKISLKNHMDFVFTSNNDFCVIIDIHDRRYFILDCDDSNANDQEYYLPFTQYCYNPETAFHVYNYLMSIDISGFNPRVIPETDEKQLYRENAIPTSVRFLQHYAESTMTNYEFQSYMWTQFIKPDDLFANFCLFCDEQREQKKWTCKAFQMSIAKYLGLKADTRSRSNNGNVRYYNLGPSAEEFIENLKANKLYCTF